MSLISKKDLMTASGLDKFGIFASPAVSAVMKFAKINKVNALYDKVKNYEGQDFFNKLLEELNVKYSKNRTFYIGGKSSIGGIGWRDNV